MYVSIPICRVAAYASNSTGTLIAPTAQSVPATAVGGIGNEWLTVMKAGSWNILNSLEVMVNGQTVVQPTPNVNWYTGFKMLSQLSPSDIETWGSTLGIAAVDDVQSYKYFGSASATKGSGGNGLANNSIFPVVTGLAQANAGVANGGMQPQVAAAGSQVYNSGLMKRALSSVYGVGNITASSTVPNMFGTSATLSLMSQTNINNEYKANFAGVAATNYLVWYDTLIVRLKDVCSFFDKQPLSKNLNVIIRMYLNTGVVGVNMEANTANSGFLYMSGANTTFTSTCPYLVCNVANLVSTNVPVTTTHMTSGLFIQKAISTSMLGVNLGLSLASHPQPSCRLHYPLITLKPHLAIEYASNNRAKRILYKNVLFQNAANISSGSIYSQLVQSGVTRITGVLIIPFLSASTNGTNTNLTVTTSTPFHPCVSAFDTAPMSTPCSLTQLQVTVGGLNVMQEYQNYTYATFQQQLALYDKVQASDLGISCGLITQQRFEAGMRFYWIDCSRYTDATAKEPRNVSVSFQNNTLQTLDCAIFVEYLSEVIIDCETGILSR